MIGKECILFKESVCKESVYGLSKTFECREAVDESIWLCTVFCLQDVQYCMLHRTYVWLHTLPTLISTSLFDDVNCERILDGICYHEALYKLEIIMEILII